MAYYSSLNDTVYHVCKNCTEGNNIEGKYLQEGKPINARLCDACKELQDKNQCTPGTPTAAR